MVMVTSTAMNFTPHCAKLVRLSIIRLIPYWTRVTSLGVAVSVETVSDFILSLSSEPHSRHVNFADFRDYFILLPRKVSPVEIYQYYEVRRYMGDDGRGPARVNMEGAW